MTYYEITDMDDFIQNTRVLTYSAFGEKSDVNFDELNMSMESLSEEQQTEINECLTFSECKAIVLENVEKTGNKKYKITQEDFVEIVDAFSKRITGNILNSLVSKGYVETAFDEKENDFVFWVKEDESEDEKN